MNFFEKVLRRLLPNVFKSIYNDQEESLQLLTKIQRNSAETLWAEIFNSTIEGSSWLEHKNFSPGRYAVGYQYLYVLYRILSEIRPKNILDLGLGQSSWMMGQYAASNPAVSHTIVEHDPAWIDFFLGSHQLPDNSKIIQVGLHTTSFEDAAAVREYDGLAGMISGEKYDLISIDAPLGGDMKQYARIDILKIIPDCLSDSFVILIDDLERPGDNATVQKMKQKLSDNNIEYVFGKYSGAKDMAIICSKDLGFLKSL